MADSNKPLVVGLAGFGTVGGGLARLLEENAGIIRQRTGRDIQVKKVLVRNAQKARTVPLPPGADLTTNPDELINDPEIDVLVELMGGIDAPRTIIDRALDAGKHIVTANKALLAEEGLALFQKAAGKGRILRYEASVAGAVPVVEALRTSLAGNRISSLMGILNGTSNYILSEMTSNGLDFDVALKQAQQLGYAEADPTLDIDGHDAAHKLTLLIRLAYGVNYPYTAMPVRGIRGMSSLDIALAREFGYRIKLIYQEPGLPQRAVRDYLTDDVCEIWVDNEEVADSIRETVSLLFPRKKELVRLHTDVRMPLWERFSLRRQLDQIYSREVTLPSGGRLVFDQTEALMAVDINSGKISGKVNFESMAHRTNMEAAEAIARQLKLRDIGGQVVIDFIEMRDKKHVLEVEKTLRTAMKNDRARHDVGRMSSFGLLELVRQRTGSSALSITMEPCPFCGGTGQRRNLEWQALQALREMRRALRTHGGDKYVFETTRELGLYLLNHKRDSLRDMEQDFGKCLEISIRP